MINYEISRQYNDLQCHFYSCNEGCLLIYLDVKCNRAIVALTPVLISGILEYFVSWEAIPPLSEFESHIVLEKGIKSLLTNIETMAKQEDFLRLSLLELTSNLDTSINTKGVLSLLKLMKMDDVEE